jgi:hypothetical protein
MDVYQTRLAVDHDKLQRLLAVTPAITLVESTGEPPTRYLLEYRVKTWSKDPQGTAIAPLDQVRAEFVLPDGYPRHPPVVRLLSPVYHPNVSGEQVALSPGWSAGTSLPLYLLRLAEVLAFQSYSLKFPLNPAAATWAEQQLATFPTDDTDFLHSLHLAEGILREAEGDLRPDDHCLTCQTTADQVPLHVAVSHHIVCERCLRLCAHCQMVLAPQSPQQACTVCEQQVCYQCLLRCLQCGTLVCLDHMERCAVCSLGHCPSCTVSCDGCGARVCSSHAGPAERDGRSLQLCEKCLLQPA